MYADWFFCVDVYPLLLIFFWTFETELQTWHEIALEHPSMYLSPNHIKLRLTTVQKYKYEDLCVYNVILQSQTPFRFHQLSWQQLFPLWPRLPTRTWPCVPMSCLLRILYLRQFLRLPPFTFSTVLKSMGFLFSRMSLYLSGLMLFPGRAGSGFPGRNTAEVSPHFLQRVTTLGVHLSRCWLTLWSCRRFLQL